MLFGWGDDDDDDEAAETDDEIEMEPGGPSESAAACAGTEMLTKAQTGGYTRAAPLPLPLLASGTMEKLLPRSPTNEMCFAVALLPPKSMKTKLGDWPGAAGNALVERPAVDGTNAEKP